jgi:hypothetical protein
MAAADDPLVVAQAVMMIDGFANRCSPGSTSIEMVGRDVATSVGGAEWEQREYPNGLVRRPFAPNRPQPDNELSRTSRDRTAPHTLVSEDFFEPLTVRAADAARTVASNRLRGSQAPRTRLCLRRGGPARALGHQDPLAHRAAASLSRSLRSPGRVRKSGRRSPRVG